MVLFGDNPGEVKQLESCTGVSTDVQHSYQLVYDARCVIGSKAATKSEEVKCRSDTVLDARITSAIAR